MKKSTIHTLFIIVFGALPLTVIAGTGTILFISYLPEFFSGKYTLSYIKPIIKPIWAIMYMSWTLGCVGLWVSILPEKRQNIFGKYTYLFRWFGYVAAISIYWIIGVLVLRELASEYAEFLAFNVTNSHDTPYKFKWDSSLQTATYLTYLVVFIMSAIYFIVGVRKGKSKNQNRLAALPFILLFPTFTYWHVNCDSDRGGLNCWSDQYTYELIVPAILSSSPLFVIISIFLASLVVKMYAKFRDAKI